MRTDCQTYQVIPGEPQYGRVRECTYTLDRDDIVEAIADQLIEDIETPLNYELTVGDVTFTLGDYLTKEQYHHIQDVVTQTLLDDDYCTGKHTLLVYQLVDEVVDPDPTQEYTTETYI